MSRSSYMRVSPSLASYARRQAIWPRNAPQSKRQKIGLDGTRNQEEKGRSSRRKGRKKEVNKQPSLKEMLTKRNWFLSWLLPKRWRVRNQIVSVPLLVRKKLDWENKMEKWQGRKKIFRKRGGQGICPSQAKWT
jgi:hypothetical protein